MKLVERLKRIVNPKPELVKMFENSADNVEEIMRHLFNTLEALCKNEEERIEEFAKKTLHSELNLHEKYHKIIEQMYTRKTMTFSREDRHFIITQLLELADTADFVVRRLRAHRPEMDQILADIMLSGIPDLKQLGLLVSKLVHALFNDFEEAQEIIWQIHHAQRNMWVYEIEFLKNIYRSEQSAQDIVYYEILIRSLRRTVLVAIRFADGARKLILKYTL